jgi:hypothetical protein
MDDEAPPVSVQFGLAPGFHSNELLNYGTAEGIKQFRGATRALDPKYNLKSDGLHPFLEKFKNRSLNQNWAGICIIPVAPVIAVPAAVIPEYNLLTQFGRMSLADVRAKAETYQFEQGSAQHSHQMYQFAFNSLDDQGQAKLTLKEADCCIEDPENPGTKFYNGPLYVKTLIGDVDTFQLLHHTFTHPCQSSLQRLLNLTMTSVNSTTMSSFRGALSWLEVSSQLTYWSTSLKRLEQCPMKLLSPTLTG